MEHNPISMGDVAYAAAESERVNRKRLELRVDSLEREIELIKNWSNELAEALNHAFDIISEHLDVNVLEEVEKRVEESDASR